MWQYIVRRLLLMIPTLVGVTIVSFLIIQLSPGDPLLNQSAAKSGQTGQSHEVYLVQKRSLGLDKPILLNFRNYTDYAQPAQFAAYYLGLGPQQLEAELSHMADKSADPEFRARRKFLEHLKIPRFDRRLGIDDDRPALAQEVLNHVQVWCEDQGSYAVPAMMQLLENPDSDLVTRRGALHSLNHMLVDPFVYTYSREPSADENPQVLASWKTWWERLEDDFQPVSNERRQQLEQQLLQTAHETSRQQVMQQMEQFRRADAPFFAEKLLGESNLAEKNICALMLRLHLGKPLRTDVPDDADAELVDRVATNWIRYYQVHPSHVQPGFWAKLRDVVADTQYGHLVSRLVRFDFGRSALKTREPVGDKIWRAVKVSAPLMITSEVLIYLLAVPLGVLCAVYRETWVDRLTSLGLFLLYSVPSFVAAMILLSLFAYGQLAEWFPMEGLHSDDAEELGWAAYLADYAWHAFLPIVCLSIFSLAGLAMYTRTSMLDVLSQDYIRTARSVGVPRVKILFQHALRNALIPIVTLFADFLPALFGGSVLVEVLFGIPGMGRLSWASIGQKDYPTLMALVYIDAILMLVSILISDLLYVLVDPRISFEAKEETA